MLFDAVLLRPPNRERKRDGLVGRDEGTVWTFVLVVVVFVDGTDDDVDDVEEDEIEEVDDQ